MSGASGQLGDLVVKELLRRGVDPKRLILVSRTPADLDSYARSGAVVRFADLYKPETLAAAYAGGQRMLLISVGPGPVPRPLAHKAAFDAAVKAGVNHIVYTSFMGADKGESPIAAEHQQSERYLRESGANWTVLRNGFYADTYAAAAVDMAKTSQTTTRPKEQKTAPVTRADCAAAAAAALLNTAVSDNHVFEITGPELYDRGDVARAVSALTGKSVAVSQAEEQVGSAQGPAGPPLSTPATVSRDFRKLTGRSPAGLKELIETSRERILASASIGIQGTWQIVTPRSSFEPEAGPVPFNREGKRRWDENRRSRAGRDFDRYDLMTSRCASPGLPRLMLTPERFRIWQRPGAITLLFEWNRLFRQVDLGGLLPRPTVDGPGGPGDTSLIGRAVPVSTGRWQGDTLVVETEGFDETTLIDDLVPHSDQLRLVERIRLVDSQTLEDRLTITDPAVFTRPWQTVVTYKRQPDVIFPENVCLDRRAAAQAAPALTEHGVVGSGSPSPSSGVLPPLPAEPPPTAAPPPAAALPPEPVPLPALPANAPEPATDPRNLDGVWYHVPPVDFQILTDKFGQTLPFNAAGSMVMERRLASFKNGMPFANASARCLPVGIPWQMDLGPFQIFQSAKFFDLQFQEYHGFIGFTLDPDSAPPSGYMGRSIARWEDDTLVVVTTGFKEPLWLDFNGTPASRNARLTQRVRKLHSDHWYLEVDYELDDPTYYTRPWSWVRAYSWRPDEALFQEYNCELQTGAPQGLDSTLVPEPRD